MRWAIDQSCFSELSYRAEGYTRHWGLDSHAAEKSFSSQSPQVPSLLVPSSPIMSFPWKLFISVSGLPAKSSVSVSGLPTESSNASLPQW